MTIPCVIFNWLTDAIFKSTVPVLLPVVSHRLTRSLWQYSLPLHLQPECWATGALWICQGQLKNLYRLRDCILDIFRDEIYSLTSLFLIVECKVGLWLYQSSCLDRVNNPMPLKYIAMEVVYFCSIMLKWRNLVSEALMDLTDNASIALNHLF